MKKIVLTISCCIVAMISMAQIDTSSYPAQRKELYQLLHSAETGKDKSCADFVAVGPKGDLSLSRKEWGAAQAKMKLVFKSLRIIPGSEIIRVYDENCGVVNFLAQVSLVVDGKDITIYVRRLEVYHHTASGWCMVAGQGTEVDEGLFPVEKRR